MTRSILYLRVNIHKDVIDENVFFQMNEFFKMNAICIVKYFLYFQACGCVQLYYGNYLFHLNFPHVFSLVNPLQNLVVCHIYGTVQLPWAQHLLWVLL